MGDYYFMIHQKEKDGLDPLHQMPFITEEELKDTHRNIKGSIIPNNFGPENVISANLPKDVIRETIKETVIDVSPENKDIMELPLKEILKNISKSVIDIFAETVVVINKEIPPEDKYKEIINFIKKDDRLIYTGLFFILVSMIFSFSILILALTFFYLLSIVVHISPCSGV